MRERSGAEGSRGHRRRTSEDDEESHDEAGEDIDVYQRDVADLRELIGDHVLERDHRQQDGA